MSDKVVDLASARHGRLDQEHKELKELLDIACDDGEDVLTEWETNFVKDFRLKLSRDGNRLEPSDNQADVLKKIRRKLERENLL